MDQRASVPRHFSPETNKMDQRDSRIARHLKTKWIHEPLLFTISPPKRKKWINELVDLIARCSPFKKKWINELAFLAISHPKRTKWINELVELLAI